MCRVSSRARRAQSQLWDLPLEPERCERRAGKVERAFVHQIARLPARTEFVVEAVEPLDLEEGVRPDEQTSKEAFGEALRAVEKAGEGGEVQ